MILVKLWLLYLHRAPLGSMLLILFIDDNSHEISYELIYLNRLSTASRVPLMNAITLLLWRFPGFIFEAQADINPGPSALRTIVSRAAVSMIVGDGPDFARVFMRCESGCAALGPI